MTTNRRWLLCGTFLLLFPLGTLAQQTAPPAEQQAAHPAAKAAPEPRPQRGGDGIAWVKDLETGMAESKRTGKPVITYWTFDT